MSKKNTSINANGKSAKKTIAENLSSNALSVIMRTQFKLIKEHPDLCESEVVSLMIQALKEQGPAPYEQRDDLKTVFITAAIKMPKERDLMMGDSYTIDEVFAKIKDGYMAGFDNCEDESYRFDVTEI